MFKIQSVLKQSAIQIDLFEAEILLAFVLKKSRTYLHTFPETVLRSEQAEAFLTLLDRRLAGEPIAYITGEKEFWSLSLKVTPAVLIPRPETELLVELVLQYFGERKNLSILDLGTGSGAIALALASERPGWTITAVDKSIEALDLARENADRLNIANVIFQQSDWFEKVTGQFDVIVSNPPYIAEGDEHLIRGDLRFEPKSALAATQEGLADIMAITEKAKLYLKPGGSLFFEHGYDQAEEVRAILKEAGFPSIQTFKDLAGLERVSCGLNPDFKNHSPSFNQTNQGSKLSATKR